MKEEQHPDKGVPQQAATHSDDSMVHFLGLSHPVWTIVYTRLFASWVHQA